MVFNSDYGRGNTAGVIKEAVPLLVAISVVGEYPVVCEIEIE